MVKAKKFELEQHFDWSLKAPKHKGAEMWFPSIILAFKKRVAKKACATCHKGGQKAYVDDAVRLGFDTCRTKRGAILLATKWADRLGIVLPKMVIKWSRD